MTKVSHWLFDRFHSFSSRVALSDATGELNYADLLREIDRFAAALNGIHRPLVAISLQERRKVIIAALAALKLRAPFLLLPPALPKERREVILKAANPGIICTERGLERRDYPGSSGDLAYLLYTSGSTGDPKGVMISNAAVRSFIEALSERVPLLSSDRFLQHANFSFDASIWEILYPLYSGARVVLAPDTHRLIGRELVEYLNQHGVTSCLLTPQVALSVVKESPRTLRRLFVGGEAFPKRLLEMWDSSFELWNAYGPTEATVCVSLHQCKKGEFPPSLGKPLNGVQFHVEGDTGELHISGPTLADGYLGEPERTKARFFSAFGQERVYASGDLVTVREGQYFYQGRGDRQVKIRGNRIELGEIESLVERMEGVESSCVMIDSRVGDEFLVAFLKGPHSLNQERVLAYLRPKLPAYMLPQRVEVIDDFPLTSSGKIDERSLLESISRETTAPSGAPFEEVLERVWKKELHLDEVDRQAHFFSVGGESIGALSVIAEVYVHTGKVITLEDFFNHPTFEELINFLGKG